MDYSESPNDIAVDRSFSGGAGMRQARPASARNPQKLCVLLVEDDEADSYLIRRALATIPRVGKIVVARDGVEALEMVDDGSASPDLALIDLHMPRKDGFALLREFETRESAQFLSVVLTSSRAGADALRSRKRGAVEFLTKPDTVEKMAAALNRVIAYV
ncbi:MAG: response regulator [Roseiarcus sp.]|jgi:CheY-like chemotaxis protein